MTSARTAAGVGVVLILCGCTSTQTTAARLQLNDDRLRAIAEPVRVSAAGGSMSVRVGAITATRGGIVVDLTNTTGRTISDLPLSVGYRLGRRGIALNGTSGAAYFSDHIPAIAAHARLSWVLASTARVPRRARLYARLGATPSVPAHPIGPPVISVTVTPARNGGRTGERSPRSGLSQVDVTLHNTSAIPQYQLPVYGIVSRGSDIVAAFSRSIAALAGGASVVLHLTSLPAGTDAADVRVRAPATIFR